jgi:hypothetical protein
MIINGRLLLLVVATGLFVRVWTANDRPRPRARLRAPDRISAMLIGPHPDSASRRDSTPAVAVSMTTQTDRSAGEMWTSGDCPIPLPAGLSAGSYRVVNDSGRVARLEIAPSSETNLNAGTSVANPEFYVLADGSRRWYFIRLEESVSPRPEMASDEAVEACGNDRATVSVSHRPFTNRKFDFSGYVDSKPR